MKPAGLAFLLAAGFVVAAAEPAPGLVSSGMKGKISSGLPGYNATLRAEPGRGTDHADSKDPDLLVLPRVLVREKRLPADAADHLMSRRDFKRKMENLYLDEMAKDGPLNYALNSFTIPILSPSKAARGRALYQQREYERLNRITELSKQAGGMEALDFNRALDNSHTTRPAGTR